MTQNLKIEVLTGDISIDGMVVTNLVTKEELSTAIVKKADLGTDGKIPTSQLPAEIVNTTGIVDEVKLQLETSIKDAVDESNAYAESYTDNALTSKADLTSGKVPLEQLPTIDQYPQFGTALSNLSTSILTSVKQRTDELEKSKADLGEDGKVLREQIPSYEKISGLPEQLEVMSTQTAAVSGELDEHKLQTADQIDALKENIEANVQQLTNRQSYLMRAYATKELGVDAKVGVKPGEYFNVRSSSDYSFIDEYQNVGGVPTPSGKSYPSSGFVQNIAKHTVLPFVDGKSYALYERVQLENGDIVRSVTAGNTTDPNVDMAGWKLGDNTVESIAELLAIPSPKNNQREYVKSYYAGLNSGGGGFVFKAGAAETEVQGFVINVSGGVWKRIIQNVHSIEDFGAHPTKTRDENTTAINIALATVKNVFVPTKDYNILPDIITVNGRNVLFGKGCLVGPDADAQLADGSGRFIQITSADTVVIQGIRFKNGYKGYGIFGKDSKNIIIDDVTVDGFSYGMCFAELDFNIADTNGCQNVLIHNPKVLNTKYWGIYLRCAGTTTESKKTQNVKIINPYFYNCNMAAFVASEGHVKNFVLENPVFERCNVCMHFEHANEFTVINARDFDTGKKPDHVQANTEYPFVNWSMYHAFSRTAKIIGCTLSAAVSHLAGTSESTRVYDISYIGTKARTFVFEGVGDLDATNKHAFKNITWDRCVSTREFIYHQHLDAARTWLRDFSIVNSTCLLGEGGVSGSGNYIAINSPRAVNMTIDNNIFVNSALRIAAEECLQVTNNRFQQTDNTHSTLQGLRGGLYGDVLVFTGNIFQRSGGASGNGSAVTIQGWTSAHVDNFLRGLGIGKGYQFENNYRIIYGAGMVYDFPGGSYTETGTTTFVPL